MIFTASFMCAPANWGEAHISLSLMLSSLEQFTPRRFYSPARVAFHYEKFTYYPIDPLTFHHQILIFHSAHRSDLTFCAPRKKSFFFESSCSPLFPSLPTSLSLVLFSKSFSQLSHQFSISLSKNTQYVNIDEQIVLLLSLQPEKGKVFNLI